MANTYTQIYIHIIFAVKSRQFLIPKEHKEAVYKYITGVVQSRKHKMIAINGMPDHIHFLVGLSPDQSISDLVFDVKTAATKFIKQQDWMKFDFSWQRGFGAFSYSQSQISNVATYIENQEVHHQERTFREEYLDILQKFDVEYDDRYVFDFFDD
jgi:putative transposase